MPTSKLDKDKIKPVEVDTIYLAPEAAKKPHPKGLLSEVIFGPTKNYTCSCGKLSIKTIHQNEVCPKCGVTCTSKDARYYTFGKIELPLPVIRSVQKKKFKKLTTKQFTNFLNPNQNDLILSLTIFLYYDDIKQDLHFKDSFCKRCVPIKITGYYSLYIALIALKKKYPYSEIVQYYLDCFYIDLAVVPPECRIIIEVDDDNKKSIKHTLVNIYIEILRVKKYFLNDNASYTDKVQQHIQTVCDLMNSKNNKVVNDNLISIFDTVSSKFQYYCDNLYEEISKTLSGKPGLIRGDFLGKNIDFSARAVVVNNPGLPPHQIKIPKKMFFKLWLLEYYRFLKCFRYQDTWNSRSLSNISKLMAPFEKSEININFEDYEYFEDFIEYFFTETSIEDRLVYINRQPTLWKYGLVGVEIVGLNDSNIISVSPLFIGPLAMDFDGDTAAIYKVHDHRSKKELYENAFFANLNIFDHNPDLIQSISNEGIYAYQILRYSEINNLLDTIEIDEINQLKYDNEINISTPVLVKSEGKIIPYGIGLLNIFADLNKIEITNLVDSKEALKIIYANSKNNIDYNNIIKKFLVKLNWFLATNTNETLSLPFGETGEFINKLKNNKLLTKLPKNPILGFQIYDAIVNKIYNNIPKHLQLYKLTNSKFRKTSFIRSLISIGYIADDMNLIDPLPVNTSILSGLTEEEFFRTSFGTRKGIIDKDKHVPDSGYMQRSMVINLSSLEIIEEDCNSSFGFNIKIQNKTHAKSMINRYYINSDNNLILFDDKHVNDDANIGKTFVFRSPITCQTADFKVCRKCVGEYDFKSPYVGVMTGQYIEERITQLIMSSFHTSGSATITILPLFNKFISDHIDDIILNNDNVDIVFNTDIPDEVLNEISEFDSLLFESKLDSKSLRFKLYDDKIENNDVNKLAKKINNLLKTQNSPNVTPIDEAYYDMLNALHSISQLYSVFVELLFANSYINKNKKVIRYALKDGEDSTPYVKYNIKKIHNSQSNALSLIFEPNVTSILNYFNNPKLNESLNIFEKIWLGKF
jgi:hypothetical protein